MNGDAAPATWVDLACVDRDGPDGALWSLPHRGDLDANLVHRSAGAATGLHVNDDTDVLVIGVDGSGTATIDGATFAVHGGTLLLVPKGTTRSIAAAGDQALVYLTVHRARPGIEIRRSRPENEEA